MAASPKNKDDQLFNPHGFKHFRRSYSTAELRWGGVVFCVLAGIFSWVIYKGRHPEPGLFSDGAALLVQAKSRKGRKKIVIHHRATLRNGQPIVPTAPRTPTEADRLLPEGLATAPWQRKATSRFTKENLYEKINGRAGYFHSFGFRQLLFTTLIHTPSQQSIDIEMYDLGNASNALGAYGGELNARARPEVARDGMSHISRNALFVSRGRYYIRAIGSEESPTIKQQLLALKAFFFAHPAIKGDALPWAYGLFIGHMGMKASAISYVRENAFSFEFGKDVYTAQMGENTYLFISAQHDASTAQSLGKQYVEGWLSYGSKVATKDGFTWVQDRYINTYSTALSVDRWVIGMQGATKLPEAQAALQKLQKVVATMPVDLRKRAVPQRKKAKAKPKTGHDSESKPESRPEPRPEAKPKARPIREEYDPENLGANSKRKLPPTPSTHPTQRHAPTSKKATDRPTPKPTHQGGIDEK